MFEVKLPVPQHHQMILSRRSARTGKQFSSPAGIPRLRSDTFPAQLSHRHSGMMVDVLLSSRVKPSDSGTERPGTLLQRIMGNTPTVLGRLDLLGLVHTHAREGRGHPHAHRHTHTDTQSQPHPKTHTHTQGCQTAPPEPQEVK